MVFADKEERRESDEYVHSHASTKRTTEFMMFNKSEQIELNVGGHKHRTHVDTLLSKPDTLLYHLAQYHMRSSRSVHEYFYDRNPDVFSSIMDYYRSGQYAEHWRSLIIIIIMIFGQLLKRRTMTEVISRALNKISYYSVQNGRSSPVSSHAENQ